MLIRFRTLLPAAILGIASALLLAGPAPGQQDDGSSFDQYIENVPGTGGDRPTHEILADEGEPLSAEAAEALGELGPPGQRTARLAEVLTREPREGDGRAGPVEAEGGFGATLDELLDFDAEGLGFVLPLILLGALIAGLAYALNRRLGNREVIR